MLVPVNRLFKLGLFDIEIEDDSCWLGSPNNLAGNLFRTANVLAGNLPTLATEAGDCMSLIVSSIISLP